MSQTEARILLIHRRGCCASGDLYDFRANNLYAHSEEEERLSQFSFFFSFWSFDENVKAQRRQVLTLRLV